MEFDSRPAEDISLIGFLFYCKGLFLQRKLVKENRLEFNLSDAATAARKQPGSFDPKELRVFIAPVSDKKFSR